MVLVDVVKFLLLAEVNRAVCSVCLASHSRLVGSVLSISSTCAGFDPRPAGAVHRAWLPLLPRHTGPGQLDRSPQRQPGCPQPHDHALPVCRHILPLQLVGSRMHGSKGLLRGPPTWKCAKVLTLTTLGHWGLLWAPARLVSCKHRLCSSPLETLLEEQSI